MLENTLKNILSVETERLKLCSKDSCTGELEVIFNDEQTMYFYPQFLAGAKAGISKLLDMLDSAGVFVYPIMLNETKDVVGFITLNNIEEYCKRIEIGYFLLSSHWKKGYAREITTALVGFLRKQQWHRIEASLYSGNDASQNVLKACGFTLEGVLRDKYLIHGKYHDDIIYSIIT